MILCGTQKWIYELRVLHRFLEDIEYTLVVHPQRARACLAKLTRLIEEVESGIPEEFTHPERAQKEARVGEDR